VQSWLVEERRYNREFVRRWWNWEEYLAAERPDLPRTFENFERAFLDLYREFTFEYAADESRLPAERLREAIQSAVGPKSNTLAA